MTDDDILTGPRAAYDAVAADYSHLVGTTLSAAMETPQDRAVLAAFAELVDTRLGPVLDAGCGPGRVTAHLSSLGVPVTGVDLSAAMVAIAREAHPGLRFDVASVTALPHGDGELGGVVAWYSLINLPPAHLPTALAELHRVLAPGGQLLLAFQAGDDDHVHHERAYGRDVPLDSYRHSPDRVAGLLAEAGLPVHTRVLREPMRAHESTPQACLLAQRPAGDASP
jgi:SAM-dependent methyltransferase